MKKILLLHLIFAGLIYAIPLDTNVLRYLPLHPGNVWVYKQVGGYPYNGCYSYQKFSVTGTTLINGKTYYQLSYSYLLSNPNCQYVPANVTRLYQNYLIRLDSLTGNVYTSESCGSNNNIICDSLGAQKNDSALICIYPFLVREYCSDTSTVNVLGVDRRTRTFMIPHASGGERQSYAMDIGLYVASWSESTYWWEKTLKGCVIKGIAYGDTSMLVGINVISSQVPGEFSLYQNYPNPFNPATKIRFQIPKSGLVNMKVYDLLGREVTTLVNEQLQPGTYEADWDGSNYPSGVYYYKLEAGSFTETKKMILLK